MAVNYNFALRVVLPDGCTMEGANKRLRAAFEAATLQLPAVMWVDLNVPFTNRNLDGTLVTWPPQGHQWDGPPVIK